MSKKVIVNSCSVDASNEQGASPSAKAKGKIDYDSVLKDWLKANGGKLEAEVRELTEKMAGEIKSAADEVTLGWVGIGRKVREYVSLLQPNGPGSRPDPYDILAAHPEVPYEVAHLRNLVAAYELWVEFGGGGKAPKLGIGFFSLILNSRLRCQEKKDFLCKALKKGWTTSQLKAEIKKHLGDGKESSDPVTIDWNDLNAPLAALNAVISGIRSHRPAGDMPLDVAESLKVIADAIADIIKAYKEGGVA